MPATDLIPGVAIGRNCEDCGHPFVTEEFRFEGDVDSLGRQKVHRELEPYETWVTPDNVRHFAHRQDHCPANRSTKTTSPEPAIRSESPTQQEAFAL